jgi:hypothetical protein
LDNLWTTVRWPFPAVNCHYMQLNACMKPLCCNDFLDLGAKPCALPRFPAIALAHDVYVRADGRDLAEDQALYQQFETDRMTCEGEGHSGNIPSNAAYHSTGDVGGNARDCMGKKGYTVVQSDVAELKRQDLAAKAAEKAQREAAAAAPPPPPPAPPKRVATKPKPKPQVGSTPQPAQAQAGSAPPAANWPASQPGQVRSTPAAPTNWPAPQTPPG